jgi:hypothetical protein
MMLPLRRASSCWNYTCVLLVHLTNICVPDGYDCIAVRGGKRSERSSTRRQSSFSTVESTVWSRWIPMVRSLLASLDTSPSTAQSLWRRLLLGNVQHFYPSCAFLSVKALTGA